MKLVIALFLIILVIFISLLGFGLYRFYGTDTLSNVDVISFQISLLVTVLTAITLGGGIIAFIGWKEIQSQVQSKIEKDSEKFRDDFKEIIISEVIKMIDINKATAQESDVLQESGIKSIKDKT